jgi:nanoRNase/pAp phosphatase (c-di-AMP/oligoRNAs hydrolase)
MGDEHFMRKVARAGLTALQPELSRLRAVVRGNAEALRILDQLQDRESGGHGGAAGASIAQSGSTITNYYETAPFGGGGAGDRRIQD